MRLASFIYQQSAAYGIVSDSDEIAVISDSLGERYADLKSLIAANLPVDRLTSAQRIANRVALSDVIWLPVIPNPDKIFCIGLNYEAHRVETGRSKTDQPTVFTRFANTLTAHNSDAWLPTVSDEMDFEGELAVVIGKCGRHILEHDALDHVAGYACFNDISIRDWQRHTTQFTPGKNFTRTAPLGPWMVSSDEIPNPHALELETRLNGNRVQFSPTDHMIFSVARLINYISTFTELVPGDIIATGTPAGVGAKREPQLYMKDGDIIEVEISGIGCLTNTIVREPVCDIAHSPD